MRALTDASVLTLSRALFSKLLGNLADIRHMWRFEALNKVSSMLGQAWGSAMIGVLRLSTRWTGRTVYASQSRDPAQNQGQEIILPALDML